MPERRCRLCGLRPVPPSCLRRHDYRCSRCRHASPAGRVRDKKYRRTVGRRAAIARGNQKRIMVGRTYYGWAPTAARAHAINAHIREKIRAFVTGLKNRKEAQGAQAR